MIKKLQKAKIEAMKSKDAVAKKLLSLLHSDALVMAKNDMRELTDDDILKCAKSLIKRNKQAIVDVLKGHGDISDLNTEIEILYGFLPAQKTEDEIKTIVDDILVDIPEEERTRKVQGKIMKQLVTEYGDSVDMGIASKYIGTKLS
jgi:uncharacterized protein YqeY